MPVAKPQRDELQTEGARIGAFLGPEPCRRSASWSR
jgi:hypothetical protein